MTLTIGRVWGDTSARKAFKAFRDKMRRLMPWVSMIHRVERQERGALHWHCYVTGLRKFDDPGLIWWWVGAKRNYWGSRKIDWAAHSFELVRVESENGVMSYASKYMAKIDGMAVPGRTWGTHQGKGLGLYGVTFDVLEKDLYNEMLDKHGEGVLQKLENVYLFESDPIFGSYLETSLKMGEELHEIRRGWNSEDQQSRWA